MPPPLPFDRIRESDRALVGGKAANLARLRNAGMPVPDGFAIPFSVVDRLDEPTVRDEIATAFAKLACRVAVRSSAVVEDGATASYAGQFETVLKVDGEEELFEAIAFCHDSKNAVRVQAYRRRMGDTAEPNLAVIVQRYIDANVSGVLFTRDPNDESRMVIELARGGSVVAGNVVPERVTMPRTGESERKTKTSDLIADSELANLADLALRIEKSFGDPCDIEWAWDGEQLWILQARPITTATSSERARIVAEEIAAARKLAEPGGTAWIRNDLAAQLPHPTPMTWALVQRMLSGDGALGRMYRDLGCEPDPSLASIGVYDMIAGRPYLNLSREPRLQHAGLPLGYSIERFKSNPKLAQHAAVEWQSRLAGFRFWLKLPMTFWRLRRRNRRIAELAQSFPGQFRNQIVPEFARECDEVKRLGFGAMGTSELLAQFNSWSHRVLCEFASHSLKPAALADREMDAWRRTAGSAWASQFAIPFLKDLPIDPRVDVAAGLRRLAKGDGDGAFVAQFGHRGPNEMELCQPRYCEVPPGPQPSPQAHRAANSDETVRVVAKSPNVDRLREFVVLREIAKHYLMLGYFQLRRMLLEFDRRFDLHGGVFFLRPEELPRLAGGDDLSAIIVERRKRWSVLKSLAVPGVLFSDDLNAIGRPPVVMDHSTRFEGIALSFGVGEGSAVVLNEPTAVETNSPFVLVCPTTDPAWTPLMLRACAVVSESGGILSHGAIVAREFGVPAVGGVADATKRIQNGTRLRVDGGSGVVTVGG